MADQAFTFSREAQRFRDVQSGRWVSEREVRDAVDRVADLASRRMGELSARFRAGELTSAEWLQTHMALVKQSQIAASLAAYGGRANMTPARWGLVGQQIRTQYAYARQMTADVLDGRQRMNGRLDARARQYGQAARSLYENIRRRESAAAGFQFEQNVLHASDQCRGCIEQTARGRVPIGSLPPIGQRTCRSNCRCTLGYSRTLSGIESEAA